jgi:uncharacterized membrane-anchored protein
MGPVEDLRAGQSLEWKMKTKPINKLPEITILFWIMKICATTLGETAGDLLSMTLKVGYAVSSLILVGFFVVALSAQLRTKRYHPFLYWTVILATSTAGTTMSDFMDRTLALGYGLGATMLALSLCLVLGYWKLTEETISVSQIRTVRGEGLYWGAILLSNTLGTALGDYLSDSSGLGFAGGAALIGALIAVILLAHLCSNVSKVILFWSAFVLTRPLGATLGDLLTKSAGQGGLNLGTAEASLVLSSVLLTTMLYAFWAERRGAGADSGGEPGAEDAVTQS